MKLLGSFRMRFCIQHAAAVNLKRIHFESSAFLNREEWVEPVFAIVFEQRSDICPAHHARVALGELSSEVNDTLSPLEIFQTVATVGLDSPRSIWPNILLLTPVSSASLSRLSFFLREFF